MVRSAEQSWDGGLDGVVMLPESALHTVDGAARLWLDETPRLALGAKRALDVLGATLGLVLLLPIVLAVGLAVRLDSRGPVLYRHTRVGRDGRLFRLAKFRTMEPNADALLAGLLAEHPEYGEEWEARQKLPHDPRVTRVGRFLRRSSLDELPQLWNVIRGDMSLVGPRPVTHQELEKFGPVAPVVLSVRPGLTGRWAVSGRSHIDYHERVVMEFGYVMHWSFVDDLRILARTVPAVLRGHGAH